MTKKGEGNRPIPPADPFEGALGRALGESLSEPIGPVVEETSIRLKIEEIRDVVSVLGGELEAFDEDLRKNNQELPPVRLAEIVSDHCVAETHRALGKPIDDLAKLLRVASELRFGQFFAIGSAHMMMPFANENRTWIRECEEDFGDIITGDLGNIFRRFSPEIRIIPGFHLVERSLLAVGDGGGRPSAPLMW